MTELITVLFEAMIQQATKSVVKYYKKISLVHFIHQLH
jgi:hypothetical protein